jgi:FAD:protein FMN transferase
MSPLTFSGLGTSWWVELFHEADMKRCDDLSKDITAFLASYEERYSRFRPDSLVSRLNQDRVLINPDQTFIDILSYGQQLYTESHGHFNMLLGNHLEAAGYDATYSFIPTSGPRITANPLTDLVVTREQVTLTAGSFDFGGYGKGTAIDLITDILRNHGVEEFLINGGGDMYGTSEQGQPITIYLEHPTEATTYLGTTQLFHQGFAASSPHKRRWKVGDTEYSHIVGGDVKVDASFILAKNAVMADVFATVALLATPEEFADVAEAQDLSYATYGLSATTFFRSPTFPFLPLE